MSVLDIAKGMGVTLGHLFKKPVTVAYPEQPADIKPRFRGRHHLLRHPSSGLEKCIGCSLCAAACPAYAIYVEAAENDPENPTAPGERYAKIYEINMLRCIFCGFCEEACPTGAVVLGHEFELSDFKYDDFTYGKEDMLVGVKGGKWQRREAEKKGTEVRVGFTSGPRPELEGVDY
ncbi:NADH-quinone oxidoreductase subunit NuoI [soil metagenome]|jgi:NADH-quinone oxidoreductase subunit I